MPLVEFRNVSYEIAGKQILSEINLSVEAGETLVLLGRSGSGKSTALKLTNGMLFPTGGQVLVEGRSTREWDPIEAEASHRLRDPGRGSLPAFYRGSQCRPGSNIGRLERTGR